MSDEHAEAIDRIERKVDEIHVRLLGGPAEPERGIIVRLDRVEQRLKLAGWLSGAAIVAALSALARGLFRT